MTAATVKIDDLAEALAVGRRELVALVGGGGKTTALFALGQQLAPGVVLTTTTKMGTERTGGHRPLIDPDDEAVVERAGAGSVLVWRTDVDHRAEGFTPETCDRWFELVPYVVVEADGSRRHPFKAPASHEPVVPSATTLLVACVGAAAIGERIDIASHRPERVAELCGCSITDQLTVERLARVLAHPAGSMKGRPPEARAAVLVNRVTDADAEPVAELAERLADVAPVIAVEAFAPSESPEG